MIQKRAEGLDCHRFAAEMERLNLTAPEAGQAQLKHWQFPDELGEAIHKRSLEAEEPTPLSAVVNIACCINACFRKDRTPAETAAHAPREEAKLAGLPENIAEFTGEAMRMESGLEGLI